MMSFFNVTNVFHYLALVEIIRKFLFPLIITASSDRLIEAELTIYLTKYASSPLCSCLQHTCYIEMIYSITALHVNCKSKGL